RRRIIGTRGPSPDGDATRADAALRDRQSAPEPARGRAVAADDDEVVEAVEVRVDASAEPPVVERRDGQSLDEPSRPVALQERDPRPAQGLIPAEHREVGDPVAVPVVDGEPFVAAVQETTRARNPR